MPIKTAGHRFEPFIFDNQEAAFEFIERTYLSYTGMFGDTKKERIIEAIKALDLSPISEAEKDDDAIIHGGRWAIKITIDIHSYGDQITPEGWIIDHVKKIEVSRQYLVTHCWKRECL